MKPLFIFCSIILSSTLFAKPIPNLHDYGVFLNTSKFSTECHLQDPGISGQHFITVLHNGQENCNNLQKLLESSYSQLCSYFNCSWNDNFSKNITIRILTIADLNNPDNFAETEQACMNGIVPECKSGVYTGRSFFSDLSNNVNIYVSYNNFIQFDGLYSFTPSFKHELAHIILWRAGQHSKMTNDEEHNLIYKFLSLFKNK